MGGFRKYILPGNEIKPGVWGAEEPEGLWGEDFDMRFDTIEICEHPGTKSVRHGVIPNLGDIGYTFTEEESKCPRCNGVYKDGRWGI